MELIIEDLMPLALGKFVNGDPIIRDLLKYKKCQPIPHEMAKFQNTFWR
jgi:hypothetical protein